VTADGTGTGTVTHDDVTVLVPTLGRPQLLECLESIRDAEHRPARLLVVDQGPGDDVAGWIEKLVEAGLDARHLRQEQRGIGRAMNLGLAQVETRFVAVTHDDCRVESTWLGDLMVLLRADPEAILTGRVDPEGTEPVPSINTSPEPAVFTRPLLRGDVLFPANMGCALATARRVGPFVEDWRMAAAAEDNDWSYRALRAGIRIRYEPGFAVRHVAWRDAAQRTETYRRYARSQGTFYGKGLRGGDLFFAARIARELVTVAPRLVRGVVQRDQDRLARSRLVFTDLLPGVWSGFVHPSPPPEG
jgi:GT2 family glycosyltransferase